MTPTLVLVAGLVAVFAATVLAAASIGGTVVERRQVARSLAAVRASPRAQQGADARDEPFADRVLGPSLRALVRIGRRVTPAERLTRTRRRLDLAGNPPGWDVDRVLAYTVLLAIVGVALGVVLAVLLGGGPLRSVLLVAVGGVLGWLAPTIVLHQAAARRSDLIRRQLPDALDLLTISVESGLGFDAALAQVARNTHGALAEEFFRVLQEIQIGTGRTDAFRALGQRTDVPELRGFVGAMVQADAFGVPVARVLRVQAGEMRVRRSQYAEEQAQKVPVKILFPLILCILPVLFVVVLGPAAVNLYRSFSGL